MFVSESYLLTITTIMEIGKMMMKNLNYWQPMHTTPLTGVFAALEFNAFKVRPDVTG